MFDRDLQNRLQLVQRPIHEPVYCQSLTPPKESVHLTIHHLEIAVRDEIGEQRADT